MKNFDEIFTYFLAKEGEKMMPNADGRRVESCMNKRRTKHIHPTKKRKKKKKKKHAVQGQDASRTSFFVTQYDYAHVTSIWKR
jgi:hypothetical protein